VCLTAARLLESQARALRRRWHEDRAAVRDLVEQIVSLFETAARCSDGGDLDHTMMRLRWWAVAYLTDLGDGTAQAITIGERLVADQEGALGADHPDTLVARGSLASAYLMAGRTSEAIARCEQTLADQERLLGHDHPDTVITRRNLALAYRAAGREEDAGGQES
jgi:Tetratricopeptide repeat